MSKHFSLYQARNPKDGTMGSTQDEWRLGEVVEFPRMLGARRTDTHLKPIT